MNKLYDLSSSLKKVSYIIHGMTYKIVTKKNWNTNDPDCITTFV